LDVYIFIDETGAFQVPTRPHQLSCVAAVVVPEGVVRTLFCKFRKLAKSWRTSGEVKGSQLNESQMDDVVRLVRRFDILLMVVAIDMGLHSDAGVSSHREAQAAKIRSRILTDTPTHVRDRLENFAGRVTSLSNPLYVQSVLLTTLVDSVLRHGTLYYSQRIPSTLGSFVWRIDRKDLLPTKYELLWRELVAPFLQSGSLSAPLLELTVGDYSAFAKFRGTLPEVPEYLRPGVSDAERPFDYLDIDALLGDLKFCDSRQSTGVQLVDILAAGVRRACNGALQKAGWKGLGRLMPSPERGENCVRFLALENVVAPSSFPYQEVVSRWNRDTKSMLTKAVRHV
jgi:hypothetical protein